MHTRMRKRFFERKKAVVLQCLVMLLMGAAMNAKGQESMTMGDTFAGGIVCPYIRISHGSQYIARIDDDEFFVISGKVVYPVSRWTLPEDDPFIREMRDVVIPALNSDSLQLCRVMMKGGASPEGPYKFNEMLGRERGQSLLRFLKQHLAFPVIDGVLQMDNDVEDYDLLVRLLREKGDEATAVVDSLYSHYRTKGDMAGLKRAMQSYDGGRMWRRLHREVFPEVRSARVVLFFRKYVAPALPAMATVEARPIVVPQVPVAPLEVAARMRQPRRELLSVKTNLLLYGLYVPFGYNQWRPVPNVAIEYYPKRGHFTFGASMDFPWWVNYSKHRFFEIRNWQVEARYYLRSGSIDKNPPGQGAAFRGLYVQGYVHAGLFEIGFDKDTGWKGEGIGAGVGLGYMLPLSKMGHWRMEFAVQVGWFGCKYDPFQYENLINLNYHDGLYYYAWRGKAADFQKRQYRYNWFGPTRVGISISYDLLYRRHNRKGASFKSWE